MKLAIAIKEYVDYKRSLGLVFRADRSRLEEFLRKRGDINLNRLSSRHVDEYLKGKGGPVTRFWFAKFQSLERFFRYVISRHHMVDRSLLPKSKPQMPPRLTPYLYSVEEVRRLLGVPDSCYQPNLSVEPKTVRTLILVLYGTGLRIGEALRLAISDVNLTDGMLTIRNTHSL